MNETKPEVLINGDFGLVKNDVACYSFDLNNSVRIPKKGYPNFSGSDIPVLPFHIGGFEVIPDGYDNQYPEEIRISYEDNNPAPQLLEKKINLIWGQGPALYRKEYDVEGKIKRVFIQDESIDGFLKYNRIHKYIHKCLVEFVLSNGFYTLYYRNKGARIGDTAQIVKVLHKTRRFARMEYNGYNDPTRIIVGDFQNPWRSGLTPYPIFDPNDPFKYPVSASFTSLFSFGRENAYPMSPLHGIIHWMKLSNSIVKLLLNFNTNSMAIKYHIKSPERFWERKRESLLKKYKSENKEFTDKVMEKYISDYMTEFANTLTNVDNVGKFVHTQRIYDEDLRQVVDWEIEVLDQKVKDYIDAQLAIASRSSFEITEGLGLHPALSNISRDGNLPSGSEQQYAFKLFLLTNTEIPESLVFEPINDIISANFPGRNVKLGFYHDAVLAESMITPANRMLNTP